MPDHIKKKLQEEIQQMEYELAHELPAEIKKAASLGDLSENAEYHMAKQRQEFVNARLGQMKKRMAELSLVNLRIFLAIRWVLVPESWSSIRPRTRRSSIVW